MTPTTTPQPDDPMTAARDALPKHPRCWDCGQPPDAFEAGWKAAMAQGDGVMIVRKRPLPELVIEEQPAILDDDL